MKTASGRRSALCFTIGLLLCSAGPLHAAPAAPDNLFQKSSIAQVGGIAPATSRNWSDPKTVLAKEQVAVEESSEGNRALPEATLKPPIAVASNDDATPRRTVAMAGSGHSIWGETSLLGKIFVGLGTLLMFASTALELWVAGRAFRTGALSSGRFDFKLLLAGVTGRGERA